MRCTCGAEIARNAKFCGKCGKAAPVTTVKKCVRCGNKLIEGAMFCGKCGYPVSRVTPSPKPIPVPTPIAWEKVKPVQEWLEGKIVNKNRAKQLLIIALVIGLCFTFTGIAGKIMMSGLTRSIQNTDFLSGAGLESELGAILNRSAGNMISKLILSIIKNDPSGFMNAVNKLTSSISSMAGDPYGVNVFGEMFISSISQEVFAEARSMLIDEAGAFWPLLQIMAYYNEMLVIGLIISAVAAILLFLLDCQLSDIRALNMQYVVYIGCGWSGLILIAAVICCFAL